MFLRRSWAVLLPVILTVLAQAEGRGAVSADPQSALPVTGLDASSPTLPSSSSYSTSISDTTSPSPTPSPLSSTSTLPSSKSTIAASTSSGSSTSSTLSSTPLSLSSLNATTTTSTSSSTINNRTQIITLAVCLTLLGLVFLSVAYVLLKRYHRHQSPFSRFTGRGASPIDDDEIATWRGNSQPMAKAPSPHIRNVPSIVFQAGHSWTWNASSNPSASLSGSGEAVACPPPVVARAPNARSGLTDEAIPGAAPFVATIRSHSRRLSKAPSTGHMRNKSRRSSMSVSSIRERPPTSNGQWTGLEERDVHRKRSNSMGRGAKTAVGRTSMGDDVRPGGLSPRPATANAVPPVNPGSAY